MSFDCYFTGGKDAKATVFRRVLFRISDKQLPVLLVEKEPLPPIPRYAVFFFSLQSSTVTVITDGVKAIDGNSVFEVNRAVGISVLCKQKNGDEARLNYFQRRDSRLS